MGAEDFSRRVAEAADLVTVALDELLPRADGPESRLTEAMRYAALGPGKRLRPFFVIETPTVQLAPPVHVLILRHGGRLCWWKFGVAEGRRRAWSR